MERFLKNRFLVGLLYTLLTLLVIYLLLEIKPLLMNIYRFLRTVLAPFFIALIISYVLHPVVQLLHQRKVPRTFAVLLIYAVFILSVIVILSNLIPMFMEQLKELQEHLPELTMRTQDLLDNVNRNSLVPPSVRSGIHRALNKLELHITSSMFQFVDSIGTTLNTIFVAMIIPFLAFYILRDFHLMEKAVLQIVPKTHRKQTIRLLLDIDEALGNYVRGQFIVCGIVGILAYLGYVLIGMPYPLPLAFVVAVFNIIPYLGPFFGAVPAIIMASTISLKMVLLVIVVNVVCQMLESNVVSPQVVGRTLNMHPLLIIFALLVGGEAGGVFGMILAVPFFAVVKVVLHHLLSYYIRRKTI
jgi:predicted PurR-regulated permease PerM